jgi:hypothetical protein
VQEFIPAYVSACPVLGTVLDENLGWVGSDRVGSECLGSDRINRMSPGKSDLDFDWLG